MYTLTCLIKQKGEDERDKTQRYEIDPRQPKYPPKEKGWYATCIPIHYVLHCFSSSSTVKILILILLLHFLQCFDVV